MNVNDDKGTSVFQNGLVWFGAAVSIAEIEAGMQIAKGTGGGTLPSAVLAMVAGHLAGGVLLFAVGCIGAQLRASAMDCVKLPFGQYGGAILAALNIIQLLGWTAVMIASGATATSTLVGGLPEWLSSVAIGILVAAWVFIGLNGVSKISATAMSLLFLLTLFLSFRLFGAPGGGAGEVAEQAGFWEVFELSAAMPLSWLPLVADYTKDARDGRLASAASAVVYTVVSCWMFAVGLATGLHFPGKGFADAILLCRAGAVGVFVVVFSTVTTTFLDAYSAGESARSMFRAVPPKLFATAITFLGVIVAVFIGMNHYIDFLYLIASVFAPMAAVQVVDWFGIGGAQRPRTPRQIAVNLVAWLIGLAIYHVALLKGCPIGATIPAMAAAAAIAAANGPFTNH